MGSLTAASDSLKVGAGAVGGLAGGVEAVSGTWIVVGGVFGISNYRMPVVLLYGHRKCKVLSPYLLPMLSTLLCFQLFVR